MPVDVVDDHLCGRSSSAAKEAAADLRIELARRSSRTSCSSALTRARSSLEVPAFSPSSMSARLTHLRTVSTPYPSWSATRWIVPCSVPSSRRSWYHQVRGVLPQHPEPRSPLLVQRSKAFDRAGVEDDDQPAALWTLRGAFAGAGRPATARGSTLRPDASHSLAAAILFADGAPWVASSSSSHGSTGGR